MARETIFFIFFCNLLSLSVTQNQRAISRKVQIPPLITQNPPKQESFVPDESIKLPCAASGIPTPTYTWYYYDKPFDPSGNENRIAIQPGSGTLIFARPTEKDIGTYVCNATNAVGTAISDTVDLRMAYLKKFPDARVRTLKPHLGESVKLSCTPPSSWPPPIVLWRATTAPNTIYLEERITMDPNGNLYITNVKEFDHRNGQTYECRVHNKKTRGTTSGYRYIIEPTGQEETTMRMAELWEAPTAQIALRGQEWRIKCIFSGSPTPRVTWIRKGKPWQKRKREESFGQELVIDDVQYRDEGNYECSGINDESNVDLKRSFTLKVEASPIWIDEPESVDATLGETAVIRCSGEGKPEPQVKWLINGVASSQVKSNPRRVIETNKITFYDLNFKDPQVVQCNISNSHGYILKNVYINVLEEPAIITDPPEIGQKVAEGQSVELTCHVFGSPKPLIVWRKGSEQLTGGRYKVMENGNLQIIDVSLVDAGYYTCSASNIQASVSAQGSLIVRQKTRIERQPLDVMIVEGTEAKFTCTASTDPEEVSNLEIYWKKDGKFIDVNNAQRMFINTMDNSLTISGTITQDTGKYSCVATNGIDEDELSAQLIIQGRPGKPNNIKVECKSNNEAEIKWQPGKENYAPILNFIIQYNTSFAPDTWIYAASNATQNSKNLKIKLSPWGNYSFRVIARNKIGMSFPSVPTGRCTTLEDTPDKNPENVIGEGDLRNVLTIFWTPMPPIEYNGPGFKYYIKYSENEDHSDPISHTVEIPDQHYLEDARKGIPIYKRYYVSVQAVNSKGASKAPVVWHPGYSGEDVPESIVEGIEFDESTIKSNSVVLKWSPIDDNPDVIKGFFRGYRIQYWRQDDVGSGSLREVDYILNTPTKYPRPRNKRDTNEVVQFTLTNMPSYTSVDIQIRVLNKYYAGPASEVITVETLEGVPGPPIFFDVANYGATHFVLSWLKPSQPNGIIIGYKISYQEIIGLNLGRLQYREDVTEPEALSAHLTGLRPSTEYRVYLTAKTQIGSGESIFLDALTLESGVPNPPTFAILEILKSSVLLQWEPSRKGNPGSIFYVQYRKRGSYKWMNSQDIILHYMRNITELEPGTVYQIRVVSKNGDGFEAPSEWLEFITNGLAFGNISLGSSPWFYGIFVAIILITILIVCFLALKRHRDYWWMNKEMEIEEQVRHLQAEEAARQMGIVNQYHTGSREMLAGVGSHGSLSGSAFQAPYQDEPDESESDGEYDGGYDSNTQQIIKKESPPRYDKIVNYGQGQPGYHPAEQLNQSQGYHPAMMPANYNGNELVLQLEDNGGGQAGQGATFI